MNAKDDEALGRTLRVQGPRVFDLLKKFGPVAAVFYMLGGGSGTLLSRVNENQITPDTLRAVLAPFRDTLAHHGEEVRALAVQGREQAIVLAEVRVIQDAHSMYLARNVNPWTPPYRGPH